MFKRKHKAISDETNVERIEHKSKKNITLGAIFGYVAILVSIASGLILTPWIIDTIGERSYGLYGLATSVIALFLLDFGLTTTTNTYLAKLRAAGDKAGVQRFLAAIFKIYLTLDVIFVIVIAGLYFVSPYLYQNSYSQEETKTLQYLILIVGGYSLVSFPSTCFTGVISTYEKFGMNKFIDLIQKLVYLGLTIVAIKLNWGVIGITAVNVSSGLLAVILRFVYMRLYLNVKLDLRLRISKEEMKSVFVFSAWSLIFSICSRLVFNVTPSILGIVSTAKEVAIFTVVITIEGYIYTFGAMTSSFFLAKVARSDSTGTDEEKREHLQALAQKIGKLQFFVISLIFFGFVCCGQEFITFWMNGNESYQSVYWCIFALCAYDIFYIPQVAFDSAMYTHGFIKPLAINSIVKAAINLGLSFWLSHLYGAIGAAIAIMVARWVELFLNNYAYKRYLKISLLRFFKHIYLRGFITLIISAGIGLVLHYFLPLKPFNGDIRIKFLIIGVTFVIVYLLCSLFITFTKEERHYYLGVLFELLHIKKKAPKQVEAKPSETEETSNAEEVVEEKDGEKQA